MPEMIAAPPTIRRIASLALPALVVLAAEPVYVLVDMAVVGHLGRVQLAALAIGGTVMGLAAWLGNVLAMSTVGRAARRFGADERHAAVAEGVQASWLAVVSGLFLLGVIQLVAGPLSRLLAGGAGEVAAGAEQWLRIACCGIPLILLTFAGNGWMRGVQDTRRPAIFVILANVLSAALCPLLVYGLGWGLAGSAVANVAAQTVGGGLFVIAMIGEKVSLAPHPGVIRSQLTVNGALLVRGAAFQICFLSATAVAARFGAAAVAAHQIALQLWMFCAFALDAVAIAAQSLVGAELGAGRADVARSTANRIGRIGGVLGLGLGFLIGVGATVLPELFTSDSTVKQQAHLAWPWFVGMLPLAGVVFALDGVLVGAGDAKYLRNLTVVAALGGFLPAIWVAYRWQLGLGGIWAGLTLFIVFRLVALLLRLRNGAWAVVGAAR